MKSFPESFGDLKSLKKLIVLGNPLDSLPTSFGALQSLQDLRLSELSLSTLPESIGALKALIKLIIRNNSALQSLPSNIGELTNLRSLDLSQNRMLSKLPEGIRHLKQLQNLNLISSNFTEIPCEIWPLDQLTSLELQNNPLSSAEANLSKKPINEILTTLRHRATIQIFINGIQIILYQIFLPPANVMKNSIE